MKPMSKAEFFKWLNRGITTGDTVGVMGEALVEVVQRTEKYAKIKDQLDIFDEYMRKLDRMV